MKRPMLFLGSIFFLPLLLLMARSPSHADERPGEDRAAATFAGDARRALDAMKKKAEELHATGVAVIARFESAPIEAWDSKMAVVGKLKDPPTQKDPGANLLGIAYAKASEMADTLRASGSKVRPPMTGEFGWEGGLIGRGKQGYWIAAFSGAKSEDDVKISRAGLDAVIATR
jgi:hypothetical protein